MTPEEPPGVKGLTDEMMVSPSTRLSRRLRGEAPANDAGITKMMDLGNQKMSIEMKMLLKKGGKGGRPLDDDEEWKFFPRKELGGLSQEQRYHHNKTVFTGLCDVEDPSPQDSEDKRQTGHSTHQIINVDHLEMILNTHFQCQCYQNRKTDDFLDYCYKVDNQMTCKDIKKLRKSWKQKKVRRKDKYQ